MEISNNSSFCPIDALESETMSLKQRERRKIILLRSATHSENKRLLKFKRIIYIYSGKDFPHVSTLNTTVKC